MQPIVFAFNSFPLKERLYDNFADVVTFKKVSEDLELVYELAREDPTRWVVGIARFRWSRFETQAVNQIGRISKTAKRVSRQNNQFSYKLIIPKQSPFRTNPRYTYTWCNYACYKLAENLPNPISFCHLHPRDTEILIKCIDANISKAPQQLSLYSE